MTERILPVSTHNDIVAAAYRHRSFTADEADQAARFCELAAWHGIKTHNAIKALHLDELFGSGNKKSQGCVPGAEIKKIDNRFAAAETWDAQRKLGQATAFAAIETAEKLADQYGVGIVSVDHAFHYLWGGGYVMDSAKRGYIAYTNCTAALAEVVPFMGKHPTLGTNPHSWAFPTTEAVGFPIVIDWATSTVAMGRVQQFKREGKQLPPDSAVDKDGNPTQDPNAVHALLPFGRHKGYGLSLINELVGAFIGGSLPTLRSRPDQADGDKTTPNFFFQVIHPDAMSSGLFSGGRDQATNIKAVLDDILGHGNAENGVILPGQLEHQAAKQSEQAGGLLFTEAEIEEFQHIAEEAGVDFDPADCESFEP
jgi:L-2-hydroxycarboxylate dehydrogenase (NAD+)